LEAILHAIGLEKLGFEAIRNKEIDFAVLYGLPSPPSKSTKKPAAGASKKGAAKTKPSASSVTAAAAQKAVATGDPRAVRRLLSDFSPRGKRREKVVALRDEATKLDLRVTPLAFCFVLRSMFEISAKAYCADHVSAGGPSPVKPNGQDKSLVDLLREITKHITGNKTDKEKVKLSLL
jgi:hypothetical protein